MKKYSEREIDINRQKRDINGRRRWREVDRMKLIYRVTKKYIIYIGIRYGRRNIQKGGGNIQRKISDAERD